MNSEQEEAGDQRFEELFAKVSDFRQRSLQQSAFRAAQEARRRAKAERKIIPYLNAAFHIVNVAQGMLNPEVGREISVELITLLESEDHARLMQPDFPEHEYQYAVSWMSACGYDNLAKHTASMHGYNSAGMHACINDGIQVCRRTGKLGCIACFREYAHDVHLAADDLEMAEHFARLVASLAADAPGCERRWVGAKKVARLLLLRGQAEVAEEAGAHALAISETYHTPRDSRIESLANLEETLLTIGRHDHFAQYADGAATAARELPEGEWPTQDLSWDRRDALAACCAGRYDEAIERLMHWDRWLAEHRGLHEWFEVRLRLIAAHRLAGRHGKINALAKQLESQAQTACDWLTLRRLRRLTDLDEPASPLALLERLTSGPFAGRPAGNGKAASSASCEAAEALATQAATEQQGAAPETTPLQDELLQLVGCLQEAEDEQAAARVLDRLLQIPHDRFSHPADAARALYLLPHLVQESIQAENAWRWADPLANRFPQDAAVLNLLAALGDSLRTQFDPEFNETIPAARLEALFRKSLELEPDRARNFGRAAAFYSNSDNPSEAERCLARGFRLDRGNSELALRLASVYQETDRARDALAVLDLCLREGNDDAAVLWEASVAALGLEQYDAMLAYLDRFELVQPGQPWTNYYRALGLIECGRAAEALQALDEEERRNGESMFPLHVLRASAANVLGERGLSRERVAAAMAIPLRTIDYLTQHGIMQLLARLWKGAANWPQDDPLRFELENLLLASGAAPNEMFEPAREAADLVEGVNFYRCQMRQPLDEDWPHSPGCLPGQENWLSYRLQWGVLARDEDEARRLVARWQQRCYSLPAVCENVELDGSYTDRPGVVWQGYRWCEEMRDATEQAASREG